MKILLKSLKKIALCTATLWVLLFINPVCVYAAETVDIIFTHDLHSYVENYEVEYNGKQIDAGGFARLKSFIDSKKSVNPDTLVIDAGDIVMGTLFQDLMDTEAVELRMLSQFGYDAVTFGNHEFDYGAKSLANMYRIAAEKEEKRPAFVNNNIDWTQTDPYTTELKSGMDAYGLNEYVVVSKNGVNIAITGTLGIDAIKCAPTSELTYLDYIESTKATVEKIKANENVDMILCISHSGTSDDSDDSEDELLAKAVPDIDVIISGHTHTELPENITVGNTYIMSCGCYGLNVGTASFSRKSDGKWALDSYALHLMDDSIPKDPGVLEQIDEYNQIIDNTVLDRYGLSSTQVIARNENIRFESVQDIYDNHIEARIGNLYSDAYRFAADMTPGAKEHPYDIAVCPSGTLRATMPVGDITVSKAFEALSLGTGEDGAVGYPLVSIYLYGSEIKTMAEVDASVSDLMKAARLYISGASMTYNTKRPILDKVCDVWMAPAFMEESRAEIEDDKLYRATTDMYSMQMLSAVTDMSKGLLSIIPKDENGNPITDYSSAVIYDEDGNELKAWMALEKYLESFSTGADGVSVIPEYYSTTHGRKNRISSFKPTDYFKNTSKFFYLFLTFIVVFVLIVVFVVKTISKNKHKKKVFIKK